MFKLPFGLLPGHWGLKGKTRAKAKAEYELSGEALERKLIEIEYDDDKKKCDLELLKLNRKHDHISKETYDYKYAELVYGDTNEYEFVKLELDKKYEKISETEYQKKFAELNDAPWVGVISSEYNPTMGSDGFSFELDWNDKFVNMLRENGYDGSTAEEIVEQWFEDVAAGEYLKILGDEMQNMPETDDWSVPSTHITRQKTEDGKTQHS